MVISFINESISDAKRKESLEKALGVTFKYVNDGEVDVVFDLKSPTSSLGKIDILLFINIEKRDGNYYRTFPAKEYLHTLVIGIKKIVLDDVIDADSQNFYNEEGSWNYEDEILAAIKSEFAKDPADRYDIMELIDTGKTGGEEAKSNDALALIIIILVVGGVCFGIYKASQSVN